MKAHVRKSKIYSYFYGANTVFQQFLLVAGILLVMMSFGANNAKRATVSKAQDNYYELSEEAESIRYEAYNLYYELPDEIRYNTNMGEKASTDDSTYKSQVKEYNKLIDKYEDAQEKASKAYEKYENKMSKDSVIGAIFIFLGAITIIAAVIWGIIKKFTSKKKDGEIAYGEELQVKIAEAKEKALNKINIISEQIEAVEPVVLNGVSTNKTASNKTPGGILTKFISNIAKIFTEYEMFFIFLIGGGLFFILAMLFSKFAFVIPAIAVFVLIGFVGLKVYQKYEVDSYVNPKTIEKLEKFNPTLIMKLGTDDAIRVTLPTITVYMFGLEQLYVYTQHLDIVTGRVFAEDIDEYFYKDVVGITSSQVAKKIFKRHGLLKLKLKSLDYLEEDITVVTSGCSHKETYITSVGNSLIDTSFVGMRNLIRQKKEQNLF